METEQKSISQFIVERRIVMTSTRIKRNPNCDDDVWAKDASHWECELSYQAGHGDSRSLITYYSMGSAHTAKPVLRDLLDCLASDATSVADMGFEDWADNLGYGSDSRKAYRTYETIVGQAGKLQMFLGREAYWELLKGVERL